MYGIIKKQPEENLWGQGLHQFITCTVVPFKYKKVYNYTSGIIQAISLPFELAT